MMPFFPTQDTATPGVVVERHSNVLAPGTCMPSSTCPPQTCSSDHQVCAAKVLVNRPKDTYLRVVESDSSF